MRVSLLMTAVLVALPTGSAQARITPQDYSAVEVALPRGAALPLSAMVVDEKGQVHRLGEDIDRPTVFIFADYACRTLCGPAVVFVADALERSGLRVDEQYRVVVMGLGQEADGTAIDMWREHLRGSRIGNSIQFLTADARTIAVLTGAVGYRYRYDDEARQYVHPAAAFVLRADGTVSRVLTELGLSSQDLRLALVEASEGRVGSLIDSVRLICSAFDPNTGGYTLAIKRILAGAGFATVLLLAGGIAVLSRGQRRTTEP